MKFNIGSMQSWQELQTLEGLGNLRKSSAVLGWLQSATTITNKINEHFTYKPMSEENSTHYNGLVFEENQTEPNHYNGSKNWTEPF